MLESLFFQNLIMKFLEVASRLFIFFIEPDHDPGCLRWAFVHAYTATDTPILLDLGHSGFHGEGIDRAYVSTGLATYTLLSKEYG